MNDVSNIAHIIKDIAKQSQNHAQVRGENPSRKKPTAEEHLEFSRWDDWVIKVYYKRENEEREEYGVTFMARGRKHQMETLFQRFKDVCDPQGEIWIELSTSIGPVHGCRGNIKAIRKTLGRLVPLDKPGQDGWRDSLEMVPFTAKRARFGK